MQVLFSAFVICWLATFSASQAQLTAPTELDGSAPQGEFVFKTVGARELKIYLHYPRDWKPTNRHGVIITSLGLLDSQPTQGR